MELFAGLASLAGLSLFFASVFRRPSALMPLVSAATAMLWFFVAGCFNLLVPAGWAWYALCAAALVFALLREKKNIISMFSPGFVFFMAGSTIFILLFFITRPMLTQWDEFTFWGTAAKTVTQSNQLYTMAQSNLIARSYPPGLIVFNYMMQFFGPWAEYKLMAAFAVFQLAALAAPSALWAQNKAGAFVFMGSMFALPFFFEVTGEASWSFLSCMADAPMAAMFAGAICLYYAGGEQKNASLLAPFFIVVAALTSIKDMGLALALIAVFVVAADMLFIAKENAGLYKLRRWPAALLTFATGAAAAAASYLLWAYHLGEVAKINRFDLGNNQQSFGMVQAVTQGLKALFGIQKDEYFWLTFRRMAAALIDFSRPVSLIGPGVVVLVLILAISAGAWLLSATRRSRGRVVVFSIFMAFCFAAFYIFNVFTYTYIFKGHESEILKDYHRYIYPFWMGWLMGAIVLLADAAANSKTLRLRAQGARAACLCLSTALIMMVFLRGNLEANFLLVSPSRYGFRLSVQQTVRDALQQGMKPEDKVYTISQGDNTTRFYMLGYEMPAKQQLLLAGKKTVEYKNDKGKLKKRREFVQNTAASFVSPEDNTGYYEFAVAVTPEDFVKFLKQQGSTHLLLDWPDEYIQEEFGFMFADKMAGWEFNRERGITPGHRYYRIKWVDDNNLLFMPEQEGGK